MNREQKVFHYRGRLPYGDESLGYPLCVREEKEHSSGKAQDTGTERDKVRQGVKQFSEQSD